MLFEYRPLSSVLLAVDEAVGPIWREVRWRRSRSRPRGRKGQGAGEHAPRPNFDGCGVTKCYFAAEGHRARGELRLAAVRVRVRGRERGPSGTLLCCAGRGGLSGGRE